MEIINLKELALRKVKINGNVLGKFGTFEIEQTYKNDTNKVIEVFYTFPISATATVTGFEITVSDKVLKGDVKEKQKAKQEYVDNIVKGNSAYLMEQDEDNSFKISIGKIDKNEEATVKITYIDRFDIIDNKINLLIPTLIKPRYNSEITKKQIYTSDKNEFIKYNVDFNINISKTIKVKSVESVTNTIKVEDEEDGSKKVIIENAKLNKDFKLEIELKKEVTTSGVKFDGIDGNKYLYLSFMPEIEAIDDKEKDYIFIADKSGSMIGNRIEGLKNAIKQCLKQLDEGDTFNIIPFDHEISFMNLKSIEYNAENLQKAEKYIDSLNAMGGTEILKPIEFALYDDNTEREKVILLFTDGEVGNTEKIYSFIKQNIGNSRIFPFGIDSSVNVSFIKTLAKYGHGKAEFISKDEKIEDKVLRTFARIQSPLVENIKVDLGKNKGAEKIEEENTLFNYEFFNVLAKVKDIKDDITLKGTVENKEYLWKINKEDIQDTDVNIELVYQSAMIDLIEEYIHACTWNELDREKQYKDKIIEIATKYNINSKYTSFITINERDEKLTDVPTMQHTPLTMEMDDVANIRFNRTSTPRMRRAGMISSKANEFDSLADVTVNGAVANITNATGTSREVPQFLRKSIASDDEDYKKIENYYESYKPSNSDEDILLNILMTLYLVENGGNIKKEEFIEYIKENTNKIKCSGDKDIIIDMLFEILNILDSPIKDELKALIIDIDEQYKKILDLDISTSKFSIKELKTKNMENKIFQLLVNKF